MKKLIILALIMLPMSAFAQKFAHVNSAVIINAMPEYTKARTDLEALAKQYEDELKRIQDEFRTKLEDYQKNGETLPETMKQRRQQELQDLDTRMTQYRQTAEEDLSKQESTKLAEISEKVGKAIKEIGNFPADYKLGTHTLRKTFGYHYYQQTHDIAGLMKLFNHSKEETTLIYIGIASDERKQTFRKIDSMYDT